ncbi:MAG: 23S rRNA (pseudouridine(1915)-N(3))-methyltransferase RlmH [Beijerinckiaceae bacterium]
MKVHVAAVGRLKAGPERELADRYASRFTVSAKSLGLTGPDIREIAESQARSAAERKTQEAAAILAALPDGCHAVRLDERGEAISSAAFAEMIRKLRDAGQRDLVFIIGGADGIGDNVTARAARAISFGGMTVPHQIARVLLLEQLYRAATLLSGHPYHRV